MYKWVVEWEQFNNGNQRMFELIKEFRQTYNFDIKLNALTELKSIVGVNVYRINSNDMIKRLIHNKNKEQIAILVTTNKKFRNTDY